MVSDEDLKKLVVAAVQEALVGQHADGCRDCCRTCELEPGMHRDDHKFIYALRQTLTDGRKTMLATFFKALAWIILVGVGLWVVTKAKGA